MWCYCETRALSELLRVFGWASCRFLCSRKFAVREEARAQIRESIEHVARLAQMRGSDQMLRVSLGNKT